MRYMMLTYLPPMTEAPSREEAQALLAEYTAVHNAFMEEGILLAAERLYGEDSATTLSIRDDKTLTTDGPFAETKEQLGGIYVFDVEDLDAAIAVAKRIPSARVGHIEIRPIMEIPVESDM